MANSNVDITNKIFTYIKHGSDLNESIKELYASSLIFIGDEQQIYVPIIDTYVGVGKSKYNELNINNIWQPGEIEDSGQTKFGNNRALGTYSIAQGENTISIGQGSHSEGNNTKSVGRYSHSTGNSTLAYGNYSHSEGSSTLAYGDASHVEGLSTRTNSVAAHAEGNNTVASANYSHTEGLGTYTRGSSSHAEGSHTETYNTGEHAEGTYNISIADKTIHTVGIGTSNSNKKNAFEIDINGNTYLINVGNYDGTNSTTATTLQDVINRHIQTGTVDNSGIHVINNIYVNPTNGDISYTYHDLSGTDSGNFVTGYTQTADGKISISKGTFGTTPHSKNGEYIITYAYINEAGKLHYNYRNLEGTDSGDFVTGYTQTSDGKISISKGTFTTQGHDKGTTAQNYILTYGYIDSTGKFHYDYRDISGSDSSDFLTGFSQTKDGKVSVSKGTFTAEAHSKGNSVQPYIVTYTYIDSTGKIHFDTRDLSGTDSGNFVTGYTQTTDGKISISKGTFTTQGHEKETTQPYVVTYTYIDSTGKIYYDYRDLSGTDSGDFVTGYTQTTDGKISISKGTFTSEVHPQTTTQDYVITYTYIDSTGKIHNNTRNLTGEDSGNFLTGFNQNADGKISVAKGTFTTQGHDKGSTVQNYVVTYTYIDANGKIHYDYRDISGSDSGNFLTGFSQTKDGKVSVTKGTFTNTYTDQGNYNLSSFNSSNPHKVVTYTYIDSAGNLHYTYNTFYLDITNDFKYHDLSITQLTEQGDTNFVYALTGISTTNGNSTSHTIAYQISGLPTKKYVDDQFKANDALRYCGTVTPSTESGGTFTLTHTNTGSGHSSPDTDAGAVYKVNGTGYFGTERVSAGDMIISYSDTATASSVTGWNVINQNIDLRQISSSNTNAASTSRVLTNVNLTADGTLSYTYYGLSVKTNTDTFSSASQVTNDNAQNILVNGSPKKGHKVLTGVSLTQNGLETQISYTYAYLYVEQQHHSSNTGVSTGNNTLSTTYTNILTGVSLSSDGTLSYSYTPFNVTNSEHADDSSHSDQADLATGLNSVVRSGNDTQGVITRLYVDENNSNILTYTYTNLQVTTATSTGTINGNDFYISYVTSVFSQDANGKITYNVGTAHIDYPFIFGTKTNDGANAKLKGSHSTASGSYSVAEGEYTEATGDYSHAEGYYAKAVKKGSHAEGYSTYANGEYSHTEGLWTYATNDYAHAEGAYTYAKEWFTHAEGYGTYAVGGYTHAEGRCTYAYGSVAHAEGYGTYATSTANYSHVEGYFTYSNSAYSHAEGNTTYATGQSSHSEGSHTYAQGKRAHAEGNGTYAIGDNSHAEGNSSSAYAEGSHAEGSSVVTSDAYRAHAEGRSTEAAAAYSHSEGYHTRTSGQSAHAEGEYTAAKGSYSHAEGDYTTSYGEASHAEGHYTYASGDSSHAEGAYTLASGIGSHAEGVKYNEIGTSARADAAHAEGAGVVVNGQAAHGEGLLNVAGRTQEAAVAALADFPNLSGTTEQKVSKLIGFASHSEGSSTQALGTSSHAEGNSTQALVNATHAEGDSTTASGEAAHSEGYHTQATANQSHTEGYYTQATANQSHAEGKYTKATSENAHAEGNETKAVGNAAHSEGYKTTASGNQSHSEGFNTQATANQAHSEGKKTIASAENAHSEGNETKAVGNASHSEGYRTYAYGAMSHIEGTSSTLVSDTNAASEDVEDIWGENGHNFSLSRGQGSHVEGKNCLATGDWSHAEGVSSSATKIGSHAEGYHTRTSGQSAHAEGEYTAAKGSYSHSEGYYTLTNNKAEHAEGQYNLSTSGLTLHSVGIGTSSVRKNAFEILSDGNAYLINVGDYNGANLTSAVPLQTAIFRVKVNNSLTTNKPYYLTGVDTFNTEKQLVGKSTAYITNSYVFVDTLRVSGNTAIGGTLSVSSTTTSGGKLTVSSGGADITGNTKVTGTFNATGAADFDSTLNVDGNATFNGNITLGNASTDTVTFTSGSVTLSNSMSFTGLSNLWGTIS